MYGLEEKRSIAREVARAGGNIDSAVRVLRAEYESFPRLKDDTVRRFLADKDFRAMVEQEKALIVGDPDEAAEERRGREGRRDLHSDVVSLKREIRGLRRDLALARNPSK
jgi:hypothetical protein